MILRKFWVTGLLGLLLVGNTLPLQAQLVKQAAQQLPRAVSKNAGKAVVGPWANFSGVIAPSLPASTSASTHWKTNIARKYPGAVLKYEQLTNKTRQQALRRVAELRQSPNKGWVKTISHSITVPSLEGLTLDGYTKNLPDHAPVPTNNIYLYRGMGLDENALRNVLKNGLRVQDSGSEANAVGVQMRLINLGTMPATEDMLKEVDVKQIYLTPRADETLHFAYMHSFENGKIPVVVTVRGWRKDNFYHVVSQDIPTKDFVEVSALIKGPTNTPVWSRVQLAKDGESFIFTPYVPRANQ